jgi:hypothetical protein
MPRQRAVVAGAAVLLAVAVTAAWVNPSPLGLHEGPVPAKSLGQMAFGPDNVLFIGDNDGAAVHAVQIDDRAAPGGPVDIAGIDAKVAQALGTTAQDIAIMDMAVHPASRNVYLTVRRGAGESMKFALLRVTRNASSPIEEVSLADVKSSTAIIPNPSRNPSSPRTATITDIGFANGRVWVAGLSNEEFASAFRQIAFPFAGTPETTTLEIYHVAHRASETRSPVMTFTPLSVNGTTTMVAAYTCTPLVAFDVGSLRNGTHVKGRTVAELGAGNQPLDLISYTYNGRNVLLLANSRHPLMRIDAADVMTGVALTEPEKTGIPRVALSETGILQLADLDKDNVVVIKRGTSGLDLKSIAKSAF